MSVRARIIINIDCKPLAIISFPFPIRLVVVFIDCVVFLCDTSATFFLVVLVVLVVIVSVLRVVETVVLITLEPFVRNLFVLLGDDAFVMVLRQKSDGTIQLAITGGI